MQNQASTRRELLQTTGCGFGSLALAGLANEASGADASPFAPKPTHHAPRVKRVIFILMHGGVSQVDSFEPKPKLDKHHGEKIKFYNARNRVVRNEKVYKALWKFKNSGEMGMPVSELFPHIGECVDDLCFMHGMHTEGVAHGPATLFLHTGATNVIRPSVGSWINYGLGTENQDLPGFVSISAPPTKGGPRNYGTAFLPSVYQGTVVARPGMSMRQAKIRHISNPLLSPAAQREQLDLVQALNRDQISASQSETDALEGVIQSHELAYRMQMRAPGVFDLSSESKQTLQSYGIGRKETDEFGRQCLMARRLAEKGVRYVQISYANSSNNPPWDQHSNMPQHMTHARATDLPVAALLKDLKQRGLLEDTLVWWGGEFGRTPFAQNNNGRDHNPKGFTIFLAGGGVKSGFRYGATDEWGAEAVEGRVHMHDLHATVLHLLGIDHQRLTYRYAGRDFRLTDVKGRVVKEIFA